jgi:hypothetical protein
MIGAILAGMERVRRYYDNFATRSFKTLNGAIAYEVFYCFFCSWGLYVLLGHGRADGGHWSYVGMGAVSVGAFGIFHAAQVIHAVARRLAAAQSAPK